MGKKGFLIWSLSSSFCSAYAHCILCFHHATPWRALLFLLASLYVLVSQHTAVSCCICQSFLPWLTWNWKGLSQDSAWATAWDSDWTQKSNEAFIGSCHGRTTESGLVQDLRHSGGRMMKEKFWGHIYHFGTYQKKVWLLQTWHSLTQLVMQIWTEETSPQTATAHATYIDMLPTYYS